MDYLDPKKELHHRVLLMVGYVCIAVAVTMAALILLYQAYGFGFGKNGTLIQNGLTFFSSQPNPANIYVNGQLSRVRTNTRLVLPEGTYKIRLSRAGYRDWQRTIQLAGGKVEHFDYPLLVPTNAPMKRMALLDAKPPLVTQSPDRRWVVLQQPGALLDFSVYDLKNPDKAADTFSLPAAVISNGVAASTWQLVDWADDNQHLLLKHVYGDNKFEYVLVDRATPANTVNLTVTQNIVAPVITLVNRKFDRYYLYDPISHSLQITTLNAATPTPALEHVLTYKSYGNNMLLYVTDNGAPAGKVLIKLLAGNTTYTVRSFDAGTTYLVDLTQYNNTLYVVAGATALGKVYIYKDPVGQLQTNPQQALVPQQVFHLDKPDYLHFSANAQYIMAENGQNFAVYDFENEMGYRYTSQQPLDSPQTHANWIDGNRLTYVSAGKQLMFDYDDTNQQSLAADEPEITPAFSTDYTYDYTLAPTSDGKFELLRTSLLSAADRPPV